MEVFIKEIKHQAIPPISIVREENDVIFIEGVRYAGDYFRTFGAPDTDVLYAVKRLDEDCVRLTVIDTLEKAQMFFEETENA